MLSIQDVIGRLKEAGLEYRRLDLKDSPSVVTVSYESDVRRVGWIVILAVDDDSPALDMFVPIASGDDAVNQREHYESREDGFRFGSIRFSEEPELLWYHYALPLPEDDLDAAFLTRTLEIVVLTLESACQDLSTNTDALSQ